MNTLLLVLLLASILMIASSMKLRTKQGEDVYLQVGDFNALETNEDLLNAVQLLEDIDENVQLTPEQQKELEEITADLEAMDEGEDEEGADDTEATRLEDLNGLQRGLVRRARKASRNIGRSFHRRVSAIYWHKRWTCFKHCMEGFSKPTQDHCKRKCSLWVSGDNLYKKRFGKDP